MHRLKFISTIACTFLFLLGNHTADALDASVNDGCTPGFFKNNIAKHDGSALESTGVSATDSLSSFGFIGFTSQDGDATTILDALKAKGGDESALMRHATAAYLNAVHPDISYGWTLADVIEAVNAALTSSNSMVITATKDLLAEQNDLGCPLNQDLDQPAPCPLTQKAVEGDRCVSELTPANDPLLLGAERIRYTQVHNGHSIVSTLSVLGTKDAEVASIEHTLWLTTELTSLDPYAGAYDYLFIAETGSHRGELGPTIDTIRGDPVLEPLAAWLQQEAGVWYPPLTGSGGVTAIDEVACMLTCLAGCTVTTDGDVPCWQACASFCAWLVLTPI